MAGSGLHNEQELLERVSAGDERAFSIMVGHYTSIIYGYLLIYLKNTHRAEEITQDIFMSVWRNRAKLNGMDNFGGYIYVIARNKVLTLIREKVMATDGPPDDQLTSLLSSPATTIELKELVAAIHTAIEQLPPRRQEVFKLSRIEHKSYEEIGELLGISRNAVKQHIVESLAFLRHYLQTEMDIILLGLLWFSIFF